MTGYDSVVVVVIKQVCSCSLGNSVRSLTGLHTHSLQVGTLIEKHSVPVMDTADCISVEMSCSSEDILPALR